MTIRSSPIRRTARTTGVKAVATCASARRMWAAVIGRDRTVYSLVLATVASAGVGVCVGVVAWTLRNISLRTGRMNEKR